MPLLRLALLVSLLTLQLLQLPFGQLQRLQLVWQLQQLRQLQLIWQLLLLFITFVVLPIAYFLATLVLQLPHWLFMQALYFLTLLQKLLRVLPPLFKMLQ